MVRKQLGIPFPGLDPTIVGRMGDVKLAPGVVEILKQRVPELGGREFGVARTTTGNFAIVPLGLEIYRLAAIEWDQGVIDRDAPIELEELREAIRRVIHLDLAMHDPVWLTRATDSSRLAERYRDGRVFLAGDAAHVHWAYGGKGLQTGIQDAGNLGWKLAAQVHGWAPSDLLDTYHAERHPLGERLMTLTRAQEALARPGEHVTALRELFGRLLLQEQTLRTIVEEITDVDIRYEMSTGDGNRHPLLGMWAPNLALDTERGTSSVTQFMCAGKGLFVDLGSRGVLRELVDKWSDRVQVIAARSEDRPLDLDAMLIRPDGYVVWVHGPANGDRGSAGTLSAALAKWFGGPK